MQHGSGRGRPRREGVDEAVLEAASTALAELGMAGLSMDVLAQRAGVSKATIYRRWSSKEELVLDLMGRIAQPIDVPDTGSIDTDVVTYCTAMAERFQAQASSDVLPHLVAASCHDPALRASLDQYVRMRRVPLQTILRRGVRRGELFAGFDVDMAVDMLVGAFMYRRLLLSDPVRPAQVEPLVRAVLGAQRASG